MKKMYFVAAAILLAVLIAGCDVIGAPEAPASSVVGYTDDGQPLVSLNVGISGSDGRALTTTLAQAGVDFYEVIFVKAGTPYRISWRGDTAVGRIVVPTGDYDNTGTEFAYMFAGRRDTKTLLGVGLLTGANGTKPTQPATEIVGDTTEVTFTVTALTTDITATSTFSAKYNSNASNVTPATITVDKTVYPIFLFPKSTTDIVGTFTIGGIDLDTGGDHEDSIKIASVTPLTGPKVESKGFIWVEGDNKPVGLLSSAFAASNWAAVGDSVKNVLTINITTDNVDGLGLMYFEIPVYMYSTANGSTPSAITWYIRGGINNQLPDAGGTAQSLGGAIPYGIGDVLGGAGLLINKN